MLQGCHSAGCEASPESNATGSGFGPEQADSLAGVSTNKIRQLVTSAHCNFGPLMCIVTALVCLLCPLFVCSELVSAVVCCSGNSVTS